MLDVWSLKVLSEVGRLGSFSAAAEALSMTQPAVSRQIAALERRSGVLLFHRLPRGVRPTGAGQAALEQAAHVLDGIALLETRLAAHAAGEHGRVRVQAFPSAATAFVPECFRLFAARHPAVELSLTVGGGASAVLAGEADLALVTSWDPAPAGLDLVPLLDDELLVALPESHPLAAGESVRLRALAGQAWIDGSHPDCLGPLSELAAALGTPPRVSHLCDDWNGRQGLVAAGVGVMVFPSIAGGAALRPDIRLLRPEPALPARRVFAAVLPAPGRSPAVEELLRTMLGYGGP
ncbi:LysR family transcriptional regulator [Nonomuraea endophytica]|uniref:DNA-binding transcriptional LysR family regulator n=1 Tax=Nonomuraea endophytica TaxID=714136 RepID=A0A7W8AAF5_9ACTN|nr:LysR family transcriptional regulator [Nonomuraea endophytica]MBB5082574.1 DNA-binding transcriptional LysR family regulator [Nonomuraea endophytica]